MKQVLRVEKKMRVRFNEVDSYHIVWHGCYAAYFEEGRLEFENSYDLGITTFKAEGLLLPLVSMSLQFKRPLQYKDEFLVRTTYQETNMAKLVFDYELISLADDMVCTTGSTEHVIVNEKFELQVFEPIVLRNWKQKWLS